MSAISEQEEFEFRHRAEQEAANSQSAPSGLSEDHPLQTTYQATPKKLSLLDRFKQQQEQGKQQRAEAMGGLASAPINAYLGAKQLVTGSLDPIEQDVLR